MDLVLTQSMPLMNRNEAVAQHGYTNGCLSQNLEARAIDQKNSTGLRSSSLPHGVFLLLKTLYSAHFLYFFTFSKKI